MSSQDIIAAALDTLDQGTVILRETHSRNLRWANSALTTNGDTWGVTLTVVATVPRSEGSAGVGVVSGQAASVAAAAQLAAQAREAATAAEAVDTADLPNSGTASDFAHPAAGLEDATTSSMIDAVGGFLDSAAAQFGYAEAERSTTYLASTAGTRARHIQDSVRFEASARDLTGSTWWGTNTWKADFSRAARRQVDDLRLQQTRERLDPGRYRVILTPSAVADLMIYLGWSANGRDAVEGHNVFSTPGGGTRLGDTLTSRDLTLFADPAFHDLETASLAVVEADSSTESVFDNGLPMGRRDFITAGRLTGLRASRPTAARFGLEPMYFADNLILEDAGGSGSPEDLIARTPQAVLINCLWYIREVDPQNLLLTGLTRDGVYRVRDGQVVSALPNFRFNVAVPDLLERIQDASRTELCLPREWADWFPRTAMPALVIDDFNLSSTSDAR